MNESGCYWLIAMVVGAVAFLGGWVYAVATWGWFLGIGLGWIPALFFGAVAGLLWPLIAAAVLVLVLLAHRG